MYEFCVNRCLSICKLRCAEDRLWLICVILFPSRSSLSWNKEKLWMMRNNNCFYYLFIYLFNVCILMLLQDARSEAQVYHVGTCGVFKIWRKFESTNRWQVVLEYIVPWYEGFIALLKLTATQALCVPHLLQKYEKFRVHTFVNDKDGKLEYRWRGF